MIEFFKKIDTFFPIENTSKFNYTVNIGNHDYEVEFKEYLKFNRKLSDKSIKNYANALKGRISEGLKKHFMPSLETIFLIDNVSFLEELNVKLFEKELGAQEFRKYAVHHKGLNGLAVDTIIFKVVS